MNLRKPHDFQLPMTISLTESHLPKGKIGVGNVAGWARDNGSPVITLERIEP